MELDIWRIFASLGVPGVALGVLYMLFRQFRWQFPGVPTAWVGPIVVLFICVTGALVYSALYFWAPSKVTDEGIGAQQADTANTVNVDGDWVARVVVYGETRYWRFSFDTSGDELYGMARTWEPYSPTIHDGKINGADIRFKTVWRNRWSSDPARIRDVWMTFRGKVDGSRIDFIEQDDDGHPPFQFTATRVVQ